MNKSHRLFQSGRAVLFLFAIIAVAAIIYAWKKQDQEKALKTLVETYAVRIDKHDDNEIFVTASDPKITDLSEIAELIKRAKIFEDIDPETGETLSKIPFKPTVLDLTGSPNLQTLQGASQFQELRSIIASDCPKLKSLNGISGLQQLTELSIGYNASLRDLSAIQGINSLITIDLSSCHQLENFTASNLSRLKNLYLSDCQRLIKLDVSSSTNLRQLYLDSCLRLEDFQGLENLTKLTDLDLSSCHKLTDLSGLNKLESLVVLDLRNLELNDFSVLHGLTNLQMLRLAGQPIKDLTAFTNLTSLEEIHLVACPNLETLEGMPRSVSRFSGFVKCPNLKSLKGVANARENLTQIDLTDCVQLEDIEELKQLEKLEFLSLAGCRKISSIDQLIHNPNLKIVQLGGSGVTPSSIATKVTVGPKKGSIILKPPLNTIFKPDVTIFDFTNSE